MSFLGKVLLLNLCLLCNGLVFSQSEPSSLPISPAESSYRELYNQATDNHEPIFPSPRAARLIQNKLSEGGLVVLGAGVFKLTNGLIAEMENTTIIGAGPYTTTLLFEHQFGPEPGLLITGRGISVSGVTLLDPLGVGIEIRSAENLVLANINLKWQADRAFAAGINGVVIKDSKSILLKNLQVSNAWGSGMYFRQVRDIVVDGCKIQDNTVGISIEDATGIDILNSNIIFNALGIFLKSIGEGQFTKNIRIVGNTIEDNNKINAAPIDDFSWLAPKGIGILLDGVESIDLVINSIKRNGSAGIFVRTDQWKNVPREIYIRDNSFGGNGLVPDQFRLSSAIKQVNGARLADILWDGYDHLLSTLALTKATDVLFIGDNENVTFLDLHHRWHLPVFKRNPTREWRGNLVATKPFLPKVQLDLPQYKK